MAEVAENTICKLVPPDTEQSEAPEASPNIVLALLLGGRKKFLMQGLEFYSFSSSFCSLILINNIPLIISGFTPTVPM